MRMEFSQDFFCSFNNKKSLKNEAKKTNVDEVKEI